MVVRAREVKDSQMHGEQVLGRRKRVEMLVHIGLYGGGDGAFCTGDGGEGAPQSRSELGERLG